MEQNHNNTSKRWRIFHTKYKSICKPINLLPLIDVCLIFFLITLASARFIIQPGIPVELPEREFISGSSYQKMTVSLTREGSIYFNDERTPIDGLLLSFKKVMHQQGIESLTIEADARINYGVVVQVMNIATDAGIKEINLATSPERKP
ncbi:MAG: biopolymer transporter ExbD [Lentisphaerae bacterium]|nr:biopolymer transporter ExbD [Lentisphaerota bacterium]